MKYELQCRFNEAAAYHCGKHGAAGADLGTLIALQ